MASIKTRNGVPLADMKTFKGVSFASRKEINATALKNKASLRAYYRMENGALTTDSSGNGYTLTNANTVGNVAALFGYGADMGASNTNKTLYKDSNFGVASISAITLAGWFKLRANPGSGATYVLLERRCAATDVLYYIAYYPNSGSYALDFYRTKSGGAVAYVRYTGSLNDSAWHHLALTYDGTNLKGYLDGKLLGSSAASGNGSSAVSDTFSIGSYGHGSAYASAYFDDVCYWNEALTDGDIQLLNTDVKKINGVSNV